MQRKFTVLASKLVALAVLAAPLAAYAQTGDWTGGYVGGHVGFGKPQQNEDERQTFDTNLDGSYGDTIRTAGGADAFSTGFCDSTANTNAAPGGCGSDESGIDAGLRAGYDIQLGSGLVVGAVGEIAYADIEDAVTAFSTTPAAYTFIQKVEGLAAIRGRVGYSAGDYLPYVTGGAAYGKFDNTFTTTNTVNTFTLRGDDNAWGYQVGGGFDARATSNVTLGLEYLYSSFEIEDLAVRASGPAPATNPFILVNASGADLRPDDDKFDFHSMRLTAAYRF